MNTNMFRPEGLLKALKGRDLLMVIALFAILIIIKTALSFQFQSPVVMPDEVYYDSVAENILSGKLYTKFLAEAGTTPPGYSLLLSIAYMISGDKSTAYHIMLIINSILTSSIIFPSYFMLRKYCSRNISLIGSIAVAVLPSAAIYTFMLMSENLFIVLSVFSVWFLLKSYETNGKVWEFLASFSVVYLYVTRSTGIAMLFAFVVVFVYYVCVNYGRKSISSIIREKWFMLASFIVLLSCWIVFSTYSAPPGSYSGGTPYGSADVFVESSKDAVTSAGSFVSFITLIIRESDYLLLSTYMLLPFIIIYYGMKVLRKDERSEPLYLTFIYYLIFSSGLLFITVSFLSTPPWDTTYQMYGRYIEPVIPLTFIFGFIGIGKVLNCNTGISKPVIGISAVMLELLALVIIYTLPEGYFDLISNPSIYYLSSMGDALLVDVFIAIFSMIALTVFFISVTNRKYALLLPGFAIYLSLVFLVPAYSLMQQTSIDNMNDLTAYLDDNTDSGSRVLMNYDAGDFRVTYTWGLVTYWNEGACIKVPNVNRTSLDYICKSNNVTYVVSSNLLPYRPVAAYEGYILYDLRPQANSSIVLPYSIDIGSSNDTLCTGFMYYNDSEQVWTGNVSEVLFEYPSDAGDANITIYTSGGEPDGSPVHVELYVNDKWIGELNKTAGDSAYSYPIPESYLLDDYQIMTVRTNTWSPMEYGINDIRDMGIMLYRIKIDKAI